MDSVKLVLTPSCSYYSYQEASNVEMNTLGMFLSDMGCDQRRPHSKIGRWQIKIFLAAGLIIQLIQM